MAKKFEMGQLWFLTDGIQTLGLTVLEVDWTMGEAIVTFLNGDDVVQLHCYTPTLDDKGWWCGSLQYHPDMQIQGFDKTAMQVREDDSYDDRIEIV